MAGNVWYIRVFRGIVHSLPLRWIEWVMGFWAVTWGASELWDAPSGGFRSALAFGSIMMVVGLLRLAALGVNGTFHDTVYARYSPAVRFITAFLCGMCWLAIALSAINSPTQGADVYPFPFIIEAITAYFVAGESGDTLRAHRNGRRNQQLD